MELQTQKRSISLKGVDDLTGRQFGHLTVIRPESRNSRGIAWLCRCGCGEFRRVSGSLLTRAKPIKSCGCMSNDHKKGNAPTPVSGPNHPQFSDISGQRIGMVSVLQYLRSEKSGKRGHITVYLCRCDCGRVFERSRSNMRTASSCGCVKSERVRTVVSKPKGATGQKQVFSAYKQSAKARGLEFALTRAQVVEHTSKDCFYCGAAPSQISAGRGSQATRDHTRYIYNGLDRVDNSRGYTIDNILPCCKTCNFSKRDMAQDEFVQWIARAYLHLHGGRE